MTRSVDEALGNRAVFETSALNVLLEAMREAVIITTGALDAPGPTILYVNAAFERMTGFARNEVIGESPRIFQGPETSRAELDRMRAALRSEGTFEGDAVNYRRDGSPFLLSWAVVPVFDDFGRTVAWLSLQNEADANAAADLERRAVAAEIRMREAVAKDHDAS